MSYQVLARKYRPQSFAELTGQEHVARTLAQSLDSGRMHHAYLFSGVRGTGKTTMARLLAKGLNCATGLTSRPCLDCPSCREIASGSSIDVIEIDAASNTGIDNVRDVIINNLAIAPARDRYKVFIIDEVHMLSPQAFNALLKTLEEPPSHVIFIMATTELHKVPETVLSRCQQFEFRQIPTEKIYERLKEIARSEGLKADEAALREIARAGAGSLRDALSAFDQVIAFSGPRIGQEDVASSLGLVSMSMLRRAAEAIEAHDGAEILALVAELSSRGHDLRNFTRELMAYLRHILVVKSGITSGEEIGVPDTEVKPLVNLAARFSEEDLVRSFHLLTAVEKEIKDSPFPRFALEIGLFKLAHAMRLRPLEELIARLEALASGSFSGSFSGSSSGGPSGSSSGGASTPSSGPSTSGPSSSGPSSGRRSRSGPASESMPSRPVASSPRAAGNGPSDAHSHSSGAAHITAPADAPAVTPAPAPAAAPVVAPAASTAASFSTPADAAPPADFDDFGQFEQFEPLDVDEFDPPFQHSAPRPSAPRPAASSPPVTAPPAAAAGAPANGREVEAIIAELERLNRGLLQTALEEAREVSYADGVLRVVFADENVFASRLRDSQSFFRSLGERLWSRPLRIDVRVGTGGSAGPAAAQAEAKPEDDLRARALGNPAVRLFIEKFRGEVIDVEDVGR